MTWLPRKFYGKVAHDKQEQANVFVDIMCRFP